MAPSIGRYFEDPTASGTVKLPAELRDPPGEVPGLRDRQRPGDAPTADPRKDFCDGHTALTCFINRKRERERERERQREREYIYYIVYI